MQVVKGVKLLSAHSILNNHECHYLEVNENNSPFERTFFYLSSVGSWQESGRQKEHQQTKEQTPAIVSF